jgi:hypothetical protein
MHYIVATVDGNETTLASSPFCDIAFDYFCLYLREYEWGQLSIEGDCNDDPNGGEY